MLSKTGIQKMIVTRQRSKQFCGYKIIPLRLQTTVDGGLSNAVTNGIHENVELKDDR